MTAAATYVQRKREGFGCLRKGMPDVIELYSWPTPNGHKVHIMLEETGLPHTVHAVDIGAGAQFDKAFLAISPNNRIPAIVDTESADGKPISVFEIRRHPPLSRGENRRVPAQGSARPL